MDSKKRGDRTEGRRWRELMQSSQAGDREAYRTLLGELLPFLRHYVGRRTGDHRDTEDIVQEVLLSLHAVRHTYEPSRPFLPWLLTIAGRRIADAARGSTRRTSNEVAVDKYPETFDPHEANIEQASAESVEEVQLAMTALSPSHREAIQLTKLQGLSLQEASVQTGKSVASLKVSVHRAMKLMRDVLKDRA